jgi:hypothetical protein
MRQYADKAARISELTRDLSELLPELVPLLQGKIKPVPCKPPACRPTTRLARCSTASSSKAAWKL